MICATAYPARASEVGGTFALEVVRDEQSADCPGTDAIVEGANRELGQAWFSAHHGERSTESIRVVIRKRERGYAAEIVSSGGSRREVIDDSETCRGLTEALPLTLALLATEAQAAPRPASTPAPRRPAKRPKKARRAPPSHPRVTFGAGVGALAFVLRPIAPAFSFDVRAEMTGSFVSHRLSLAYAPPTALPVGSGSVTVDWLTVGSAVCFAGARTERSEAHVCAGVRGGSVAARATGVDRGIGVRRPWFAPTLGASYLVRWDRHVAFSIAGELLVPVRREAFYVEPLGPTYEPGIVGVVGWASVLYSIP